MNQPFLFALDFDGVICDSAVETALAGWKAAGQLWTELPPAVPQQLVERFRAVRPLIETGYEAILTMRLLQLGVTVEALYAGYTERFEQLLQQTGVSIDELKKLFGATRDQWIADDLPDWIAHNPLFPGIAEALRDLADRDTWYVVTTKQERFVQHILAAHRIDLPSTRIFGLDRKMPKPEVLKGLQAEHPQRTLCFVEDRLPALQGVIADNALTDVQLRFALWGYNSREDRTAAAQQGIVGLELPAFVAGLAGK